MHERKRFPTKATETPNLEASRIGASYPFTLSYSPNRSLLSALMPDDEQGGGEERQNGDAVAGKRAEIEGGIACDEGEEYAKHESILQEAVFGDNIEKSHYSGFEKDQQEKCQQGEAFQRREEHHHIVGFPRVGPKKGNPHGRRKQINDAIYSAVNFTNGIGGTIF